MLPLDNMPRYQCHKRVSAVKIKRISYEWVMKSFSTRYFIEPEEQECGPFEISTAYVDKHHPIIGGYYVVYDDGYESYSPPAPFEEGYTRI